MAKKNVKWAMIHLTALLSNQNFGLICGHKTYTGISLIHYLYKKAHQLGKIIIKQPPISFLQV